MKWLVALAVIVGLLWLGGDRLSGWIDFGRETAGGLAEPVYGLSRTLDETRARVDETNRKIGSLGLQADAAAGLPGASGSVAAYGAKARRDLEAMSR